MHGLVRRAITNQVDHRQVLAAVGWYEVVWRDQIEPIHDLRLEAMLDNVGRIVAPEHSDSASRE